MGSSKHDATLRSPLAMAVNYLADTAPAATATDHNNENEAHHDVTDDTAELAQTFEAFVAGVSFIIDRARHSHLSG